MSNQSIAEQLGLVSHEAESAIIGAMQYNEELALSLVQQLDAERFYDPRRKVIFAAMKSLLLGIEPFNRENLLAECRKIAVEQNKKNPVSITGEYLDSLKGDTSTAVRSAITVHRLAWLREAGDYAHWLVKALQMNPEPNELYTEAQSRWQLLAPEKKQGAVLYGWDTIRFAQDVLEQRKQDAQQGLTRRFDWPWDSWNKYIRPMRGGLGGVIAAPDGVGKSMFLEWIAEHWAQKGNKTVLVHLEDSHEYKIDRRLARWSRVPLENIEDGNTTPEQDRMLRAAEEQIAGWVGNLHYMHAPGWSMSQVLVEAKKLVDEGQCDCIVLDYMEKVKADRRQVQLFGNNEYSREGDDMEQLKTFGEQNDLPFFTASQGNKGMQDQGRIKTRQDIGGSGKKTQKVQLVLILTRDMVGEGGLYDGDTKIADAGDYSPIATLKIDKQNRGQTRTFHQVIRGECFRIGDLPAGYRVDLNGGDSDE